VRTIQSPFEPRESLGSCAPLRASQIPAASAAPDLPPGTGADIMSDPELWAWCLQLIRLAENVAQESCHGDRELDLRPKV
jgi:hypothetical protein